VSTIKSPRGRVRGSPFHMSLASPLVLLCIFTILAAGCSTATDPPPSRIIRVGYLGVTGPDYPWPEESRLMHFQRGLRDLGYIEGKNLIMEYRFAGGDRQRIPELTEELVGMSVDVIVLGDPSTIPIAMEATRTTPLVMTAALDPVESGYIESLSHPGGNVTGMSSKQVSTVGKRLELLQETLPSIRQVVVAWQPYRADDPSWREIRAAAGELGLELHGWEVTTMQDGSCDLMPLPEETDALIVLAMTPGIARCAKDIMSLAADWRVPVVGPTHEWATIGALLTLGPDYTLQFHRAATYVDKIVKGAHPADLPVEQPIDFVVTLNAGTASMLYITVPDATLAQITRVVPGVPYVSSNARKEE
jgi:putative tryptophan/tyrosine transport system substrate-binding protein